MKKQKQTMVAILLLSVLTVTLTCLPTIVSATPLTPVEWQDGGKLKNWVQDQNGNFVADLIKAQTDKVVALKAYKEEKPTHDIYFFSTEEEFITQGLEPPDGNPIISDGDLLGPGCVVFARNQKLLAIFKTERDLGLDAADVIDVERFLVAFSTELDDPQGRFTSGDLLATNGAVIPNLALLANFNIPRADLGMDAIHFIGDKGKIIAFLEYAAEKGRDFWRENPDRLPAMLKEYDIDVWFSTEGTAPTPEASLFLDGDLLSARMGKIVIAHADLLPSSVPAGIPDRGVDFGLDAATADRSGNRELIHFSTEILYEGRPSFTDGDVLFFDNGLVCTNEDLVRCFEPNADELGLDALSLAVRVELKPQITHFNQVSVSEISASGLAYEIEQPFGQWIQIHGYIPDDVDEFRVVYCNASDWPCTESEIDGIEVVSAQNWHVDTDDGMGGCTGDRHWYSDADGWFNASNYRALRDCTSDLPLTMWNSLTAPDPDGLYIVWLQYRRDGIEYGESYNHYIQLDNTRPENLAVAPKEGAICGEFTPDDMPMMVQGHFNDTHFWWYKLVLYGGDPLGIEDYGRINHYDSLTDNVGPEGTTGPGMVDLHKIDINNLPAKSIDDCAYTVRLWTWDRTIRGNRFDAPNDDRPIWFGGWYSWTAFTFDYTP
ncbi:hypothetical protein DRN97_06385 [Methanosarcinales archaeon]|nr:MAG: hypothetical protein DRN97_06385 [Methanosarcinales archaeon]